jgi:hypothetical protein
MSKNICVIVITVVFFLLPGCSLHTNKNKAALQKKAAFSFDPLATQIDVSTIEAYATMQEVEAKLFDIPTMIGSLTFEPNNQPLVPGESMIASLCTYDRDVIADFYLKEMVRLGWLPISTIHGFEWVLLFQKPQKLCIINLRSCSVQAKNGYQTLIHITICNTENNIFES